MHVVMYEEEEEEMDMSLLGSRIATWRSKSLRSSVLDDDDDAAKVRTKWPRWRTWWWLFAAAAAGEAAARRRGSTKEEEEEEEEMTRAGAVDIAPGREYIVYSN
jgi:hypothetical protein